MEQRWKANVEVKGEEMKSFVEFHKWSENRTRRREEGAKYGKLLLIVTWVLAAAGFIVLVTTG